MYIADMYRGMIEGAEWAREGTYLRLKIKQYQLDKITGHGRIWRLTYDGIARDQTDPRMLTETPGQLVAHLSHPNGWWRDTAQQLLVLKQDQSVVPALRLLLRSLQERRRPLPCPVDARGAGRSRGGADTRTAAGSRAADAHPGTARQRDAVQGRRYLIRHRLPVARERRQRRRRHPGIVDDERSQGSECTLRRQSGGRGQHGTGGPVRRKQDPQSARCGESGRAA